jgi:CheY-like chemotaxis protein
MTTVLVAYEASATRIAMRSLLEGAGYDVLAATPDAALDAARSHGAVQLLITDDLPLLQGRLGSAERLRAEQPQLRVLYARSLDGTDPGNRPDPLKLVPNLAR